MLECKTERLESKMTNHISISAFLITIISWHRGNGRYDKVHLYLDTAREPVILIVLMDWTYTVPDWTSMK